MQGILELRKLHKDLPCDSFKFFTHGGMIFLFTTSAMFAVVSVNLLYVIHTHTHTERHAYKISIMISNLHITFVL